jgi:glycosyltransferase involved in cell wall biosynthesis
MKISLLATVLNEGDNIHEFLDNILAQTVKPDEMIIVDGGSRDDTLPILREYAARGFPLRVLSAPGTNIPQGRNIAIREAIGDVLAITDAGAVAAPDWLEKITRPFRDGEMVDLVGGHSPPVIESFLDYCLAASYVFEAHELNPRNFYASGRNTAVRREVMLEVGGYPDWLPIAEDMYLSRELWSRGYKLRYAPEALVSWKQRKGLRQVFRQFFLYGKGDARGRVFSRDYARKLIKYTLGVAAVVSGFLWPRLFWLVAAVFLLFVIKRITPGLKRVGTYGRGFTVPLQLLAYPIVVTLMVFEDLARGLGYVSGTYHRLRGDW